MTMTDIQNQDTITIPIYHHYRREDGYCWHWTSYSSEASDEIPSDADQLSFDRFPEIPFKTIRRPQ